VVLSMLRAFPGATLFTSFYLPDRTFPEFAEADVRVLALNRIATLRNHHRLALPFLASAFSRLRVDADVVLCSSSGWAHGVTTSGRKIVYCHTPAHWLYQHEQYLGQRNWVAGSAMMVLRRRLIDWDQRAASSAHRYLTQSSAVRERIGRIYGIRAQVLPAPFGLSPMVSQTPVPGVGPGYLLCVSRLLPYKNIDALLKAATARPAERLVIVGTGPERARLQAAAPSNANFLGVVSDEVLAWLYANCKAVISASFEDYGLTPLEGAAFGKPAIVLRAGGFIDTVLDGVTGVFFDRPEPVEIVAQIDRLGRSRLRSEVIARHAERFSEYRFIRRLRRVVEGDSKRLVSTG
jgi:glycosyltransferase involved in cell wall biosynthesis